MNSKKPKVVIVGCGQVGSTFASFLSISGLAREIRLINRNKQKAVGEAMDLNHGASFIPPVDIIASDYDSCRDADVVVITAGVAQKPGDTRMDLVSKNVEIFKDIIPRIIKHTNNAVLLVVTNPVDVLTYVALKLSGFPPNQVMGAGTVLDSSRLRYLIGRHCGVDPRNVHAYIIGEHGDTELPLWSSAYIGGVPFSHYCPVCTKGCDHKKDLRGLFNKVKNAAYEIIEAKGATYYAISLALVRIVKAILRDENSVLPVSTFVKDYYGVSDVCLSVPSIINRRGVDKIIRLNLSQKEQEQFKHSARTLKKVIEKMT